MEKCCSQPDDIEAISAFDTLFTTNHMKILKILFPYLNCEFQKKLAVYIKWQELIFTLNISGNLSSLPSHDSHTQKNKKDISSLLSALLPYCSEKEREYLSSFSNMQNMISMVSQIQDYLPVIQTFFSQMQGNEQVSDDSNMMDVLKNMMSDEQLSLFSMFMNGG